MGHTEPPHQSAATSNPPLAPASLQNPPLPASGAEGTAPSVAPDPAPLESVAVTYVELASVLDGATPFKEGNINDTYRGLVSTKKGEITVIIKDLDPIELANEILSAAIGLALGAPIPQPYLALASEDRLAATKGPEVEGGRLVFASADVKQPSVRALAIADGSPQIQALINRVAAWPRIGEVYGLDGLVANIDRNAGNLLLSGSDDIWLIDHGHALTGPNWTTADLHPADKTVSSRLQEWLTPHLETGQRATAEALIGKIPKFVAELDLAALAEANHLKTVLDEASFDAAIKFLTERSISVPQLANAALASKTVA